jgi:hypothetical protein
MELAFSGWDEEIEAGRGLRPPRAWVRPAVSVAKSATSASQVKNQRQFMRLSLYVPVLWKLSGTSF